MSDYKLCSQGNRFAVAHASACSQEGSVQGFMSSWRVDYKVL